MKKISILIICLLLAGCSVKRPVLYPNAKLQKVGQAQAQQDIDICCRLAAARARAWRASRGAEDKGSPPPFANAQSCGGQASQDVPL